VCSSDLKWGPSYFDNKGPVHFDELYIKFISDESVIYAALETGEATLASLPTQFLDKAKTNPKLVVGNGIDWSDWYLGMNDSKAPFDNKDFRIAVAYAINRDEIIQAAWGGQAFALYSSLPPSTYGYQESQNEYGKAAEPYDPAKAKELLGALGYVADSSGVLAKDGKELSFKLNFPAGDPTKRAAETIQAQLAEVGIKVDLGQMEAAAISDMLKKCDQDFFLRPFGLSDGSILSAVFASARMNASNRNCFVEADTDKLIAAADSAMDPTARMAALDALVKHLVDVRPHIPLWANYLYTAYQANLQGLKFDKAGNAYFNDAYFAK
jgi:peptide/nickel transport system substrate-binding protein